ncbi:MAG TPA: antitoxin VapB family protein [Candidatus Nanoarchaeia archaeon]|nr:antitoxin VapB family protein [Candidatus Nanoarchaeia archaeon]
MATKTISITEEAYERLRMRKSGNESFTDVINKITGKVNIMDFVGILNDREADELERGVKKSRELSRKRTERLRMMMNDS